MKLPISVSIVVAILASGVALARERTPEVKYRQVPQFGIPDEFYTVHEYFPAIHLARYEVADPTRPMTKAEKLSAARLIVAANDATYQKYGQSYGVNMKSPLLRWLTHNFEGLGAVEPSHEVGRNEIPIRDLSKFMRAWLLENTKA